MTRARRVLTVGALLAGTLVGVMQTAFDDRSWGWDLVILCALLALCYGGTWP